VGGGIVQVIAVTGASGHLGQWVVAWLTTRGHEVLCVSRGPSLHPSIDEVRWSGRVRTLACDLAHPGAANVVREGFAGVRAVVHLAAFVPEDTAANLAVDAGQTLQSNVGGTVRLLEGLSGRNGLECFVNASTFEVYGHPASSPISEDHPTDPLGYYGASKLAAEKYVALFAADRRVACCSLRFGAIYGPGDTRRRAVGNFVRAAAAGEPITVYGDGSDRRDLVTAADAAGAIGLAVERKAAGTMNIGSGRGFSILEIAEAVSRAADGGSPVEFHGRARPRLDYVLDIGRAGQHLGWTPRDSLEAGVRAHLEWERGRRR
jgi:UDP-glucose 4-epimerase